ncbi:uncharacterized protein M6B38_113145 [Iris pallida]|uniref:Uncharacterized protein n=1 Tax=Iris pallida TaxID=29817 RepID=A0AAX6IL83_IRIPA|nr:uncharacterized protein M6B38_113145 [Iris pallida]
MPKCIKYMFLNVNNLLIIICFPTPKNPILRSETADIADIADTNTHRNSPILIPIPIL